jgi:hypothetical protein
MTPWADTLTSPGSPAAFKQLVPPKARAKVRERVISSISKEFHMIAPFFKNAFIKIYSKIVTR